MAMPQTKDTLRKIELGAGVLAALLTFACGFMTQNIHGNAVNIIDVNPQVNPNLIMRLGKPLIDCGNGKDLVDPTKWATPPGGFTLAGVAIVPVDAYCPATIQ